MGGCGEQGVWEEDKTGRGGVGGVGTSVKCTSMPFGIYAHFAN